MWLTRFQATLQRWRVTVSFVFSVIAITLAKPTVRLIVMGGVLALLGVGLRAWATGHLRKDQELSTSGPYAYTRNPLYLGSFLIGLGVIIACGRPLLLLTFLVLFFLLYGSAMRREADHLRRLFPDQYPPYEKAVPAFLPRLRPYSGAARRRFSWALWRVHREHRVGLVLVLILAILLLRATLASAQLESAGGQATQPTANKTQSLPFVEGEVLHYEARYSKLFLSGKIGVLTFTFTHSAEPPLAGHHLIKVDVLSEGFWPKLLGIEVKDVFESFVDPTDFGVVRTRKQLSHQGKNEFELAVFDRRNGTVMVISRDLTNAQAQPETRQEPTRPWVQDIVSAIYHLRTVPLTVGQTIEIPLSDSGKTYDIPVKVHAQEQLHTKLGPFNTLKVQPQIFGQDKLIRKEGELYIWLTDDARRLPVRAWVRGSFGAATIELTSMSIPG